jgi:hypothetical protein
VVVFFVTVRTPSIAFSSGEYSGTALALPASIRFRREDPGGQQFYETDQLGSAVRRRFCNRISMVSMRSSLRSRWTS